MQIVDFLPSRMNSINIVVTRWKAAPAPLSAAHCDGVNSGSISVGITASPTAVNSNYQFPGEIFECMVRPFAQKPDELPDAFNLLAEPWLMQLIVPVGEGVLPI